VAANVTSFGGNGMARLAVVARTVVGLAASIREHVIAGFEKKKDDSPTLNPTSAGPAGTALV